MSKEQIINVTPQIDEEAMMNLMADGVKKEGLNFPNEVAGGQEREMTRNKDLQQSKPLQKERNRPKKNLEEGYGEHFLKNHSMTKRGDKSIYIRQEYHERLSRIVQVIGKDELPLYAYLDNILEHHFELFEKAITDDFNKKFKPIF